MVATTMTALAIAAVAMIFYDIHDYRLALTDDLATQADIIGQSSAPALLFDDRLAARRTLRSLKAKRNVVVGALYTARGGLFAFYTRAGVDAADLPSLPEAEGASIRGKDVDSA